MVQNKKFIINVKAPTPPIIMSISFHARQDRHEAKSSNISENHESFPHVNLVAEIIGPINKETEHSKSSTSASQPLAETGDCIETRLIPRCIRGDDSQDPSKFDSMDNSVGYFFDQSYSFLDISKKSVVSQGGHAPESRRFAETVISKVKRLEFRRCFGSIHAPQNT